ncbi:MAG: AgmX/PglI C-terminal domain-containing protein [Deltaproteobacteria bacterium]|nr:AgmX/PglI C-terminal domain-containing protein [Deltaproteobacteria bacterium]
MRCTAGVVVIVVVATLAASARIAEAHLDPNVIRRVIRKDLAKFTACYEQALATDPALEGSVSVSFKILADGTVAEASAKGMPAIDACIERAVSAVVFPKMRSVVQVTYPFVFRPAR